MKTKHSIIIQWNEEDKVFVATVPEIEGLNAFGTTPEKAIKELNEAKELFLETLQEDGEEIPEPDFFIQHSGQLRIRIPKSLHTSLSQEAKKEDISLNTFIVHLLSERNTLARIKRELENFKNDLINDKLENRIFNQAATLNSIYEKEVLPDTHDNKVDDEIKIRRYIN